MRLILASTSPRRLELLRQIGISPDGVVDPSVDEAPLKNEIPHALAARLAEAKAHAGALKEKNALILAGDTVVACGRRLLPKCENTDEVKACLTLLSGRRHRVYGGVCVLKDGKAHTRVAQSVLAFRRLTPQEIDAYARQGEGIGKAGGYALQGFGARFVRFMSGSPSNVIGLPLFETAQLLKATGYDTHA